MTGEEKVYLNSKAVGIYGVDNILIKSIEDMSGLIKELGGYLTGTCCGECEYKLITRIQEAMVDVYIAIDRMIDIFDCPEEIENRKYKSIKKNLKNLGVDFSDWQTEYKRLHELNEGS